MIDQTLTTPPDAPSSNDIPTFRTRFDAFIAWIVIFVSQLSTVITQINSTATTINTKEASAVSASDAAVSAANFQGTWSSATSYTIGQSVAYNGNTYKSILASTNQLPTNTTYWVLLTGIKKVNNITPDVNGNVTIEDRLGSAIASAATIAIGTAGLGDYIHITGTTAITSLGTASSAGVRRTLIFDSGGCVLTHSANIICPGAVSITSVAATVIEVIAETTTTWRVVSVTHPNISHTELGYLDGVTSNIQTQFSNLASANNASVMSALNATGSAPIYANRAWVNFNGTGAVAIRGSGNISSVGDNGTGSYSLNFTTAMPDGNYGFSGFTSPQGIWSSNVTLQMGNRAAGTVPAPTTTVLQISTVNAGSGSAVDAEYVSIEITR